MYDNFAAKFLRNLQLLCEKLAPFVRTDIVSVRVKDANSRTKLRRFRHLFSHSRAIFSHIDANFRKNSRKGCKFQDLTSTEVESITMNSFQDFYSYCTIILQLNFYGICNFCAKKLQLLREDLQLLCEPTIGKKIKPYFYFSRL